MTGNINDIAVAIRNAVQALMNSSTSNSNRLEAFKVN